jgi:hypothetical protein
MIPARAVEAAHIQCEDCGKCRVTQEAEEWCGDCEYWSCERQEDCKDAV